MILGLYLDTYMTKNPFINAFVAVFYIAAVASVMFFGSNHVDQSPSIVAPIALISLFTLSAAVMGYIFLYQPFLLFIDGKRKEAVDLFLKTTAAFATITIFALAVLFFPRREKEVACTLEAKICPDGSSVGRTGPNCEFSSCPARTPAASEEKENGNPKEELVKEIQKLFVEKYPKYAATISIKVNGESESHVWGGVSFKEGAPGGIFLASKVDGRW